MEQQFVASEFLARRGIDPASVEPDPPFDIVAFRVEQARTTLQRVLPPRFAEAKADHPKVAEWVARYLAAPTGAPSLLLTGITGVGKTWQCWGAVRGCAEGLAAKGQGLVWRATTHPDLNAAMRPSADGSHATALEPYLEAGLLMLDDLGAGKQTEWTGDTLYRLIDHRWSHGKVTVFSTNMTLSGLSEIVGDRVVSRLADTVKVKLLGSDRRWAATKGAK